MHPPQLGNLSLLHGQNIGIGRFCINLRLALNMHMYMFSYMGQYTLVEVMVEYVPQPALYKNFQAKHP